MFCIHLILYWPCRIKKIGLHLCYKNSGNTVLHLFRLISCSGNIRLLSTLFILFCAELRKIYWLGMVWWGVRGIGSVCLCFSCLCVNMGCLFVFGATAPQWARPSSFTRFLDHTQRRNTVGRTPLDEWSARRRDLYLTTHNTHNRQTSMPLVGFEPTITAGERPQTYALNRAATGTGRHGIIECIFVECGELLSRIFTQKSWIGCNIIVRC